MINQISTNNDGIQFDAQLGRQFFLINGFRYFVAERISNDGERAEYLATRNSRHFVVTLNRRGEPQASDFMAFYSERYCRGRRTFEDVN